jgi:uncharacterized protein (DUF2336 family)
MIRIVREIEDALEAVALARAYFNLEQQEPEATDLDLKLWQLLKRGSPLLRAEMAEQLANLPNGPPRTLRALACDPEPEIAGPILSASPAISDAAIAEMARCKADGHLAAIAMRPNLSPKVSGILARRGGPSVLHALSRNHSVRLSAQGREILERRLQPITEATLV